jgi:hypothetical protein
MDALSERLAKIPSPLGKVAPFRTLAVEQKTDYLVLQVREWQLNRAFLLRAGAHAERALNKVESICGFRG